MGALGIILEDAAIRRANRRHHRAAMRQSREIARQARREITTVAQHYDRTERRKAAAAELPAGRMARVVHRTGQVNELVEVVAGILVGLAAIQAAVRELRQQPERQEQ